MARWPQESLQGRHSLCPGQPAGTLWRMSRILGALLIPVAVFCWVGFLAAGEPGNAAGWRIGYAVASIGAVLAAGYLLIPRDRSGAG
ncbi:MAG: hypothetical protein ACJAZN_003349 [Planctomycetota bacterium]